MFTKNYFKYRRTNFDNTYSASYIDASGNTCSGAKYDFGSKLRNAIVGTAYMRTNSSNFETYANPGIYFGTGTTPATEDDITLEKFITSGITVSSSTPGYSKNAEGMWIVQTIYIVTNTSEEEISISEIGFFSESTNYSSSNKNYEYHPILFERTVLENPIVIPSGEARVINYQLNMNQSCSY